MGYPLPWPGMGYSPARSGWEGYTPWLDKNGGGVSLDGHPSSQRWGTVPPPGIGQHREYLLRGRRYASYVHGGGLSCARSFSCSRTV